MHAGNCETIEQLLGTVKALSEARNDMRVSSARVKMRSQKIERGFQLGATIEGVSDNFYTMTDTAFTQVVKALDVPLPYARALARDERKRPLLDATLNYLTVNAPDNRFIRLLEDNPVTGAPLMRAWLSDRYRPLDNVDLLEYALVPVVEQNKALEIQRSNVDLDRMHITLIAHNLKGEVRKGDVVQGGIIIGNSEVGVESLWVEPFIMRLVCLNGMRVKDARLRQVHLGGSGGDKSSELIRGFFTDETRAANDKATFMQFRDVIAGAASEDGFNKILDDMRQAAETTVSGSPNTVLDALAEIVTLTDVERGKALENLMINPGNTRWDYLNAVTAVANVTADYNRASHIEAAGGIILNLPDSEWRKIEGHNIKRLALPSMATA